MSDRNKEDIQELLNYLENDVELKDFWQALSEGVELNPMPGVDGQEWQRRSAAYLDMDEDAPGYGAEQDWVVLNTAGHPYAAMVRLREGLSTDEKLDVQMMYDYLQNELDIGDFQEEVFQEDCSPAPGVDEAEWRRRSEQFGDMDDDDPEYQAEANWVVLNSVGSPFAAMERLRLNLLESDDPAMELDPAPTM